MNILKYSLQDLNDLSFFYTSEFLSYESESTCSEDNSFILQESDCKLIAPLIESKQTVGAGDFSFIPIAYITKSSSLKIQKKLINTYIDIILKKNKKIFFRQDPLVDYNDLIIKSFLDNGFDVQTHFTSIIELTDEENILWSKIRKSYKSLINNTIKKYDLKIYKSYEKSSKFFQDWKKLYNLVTVRGNAMPSEVTWIKMEKLFKEKKVFFIAIYIDEILISAIEIGYTDKNAYYFHGATDPKYEKNNNFTHGLIWQAIKELKSMGCEKFEIGPIFFNTLSSYKASKKELNISSFKIGMGGKLVPFLIFKG